MKQSGFMKRQQEMSREYVLAGVNIGMQQAADAFAIALHDSSLMGKNAFGAARIKAVTDRANQIIDEFFDAWRPGPEQDYMQEKFDRVLRDIFKEETIPFAERYPYIKEQKYRRIRK